MSEDFQFRVLGPIDLVSDGTSILPSGSRQRDLLALLLLEVDHTVSVDRLIDRLWDGTPPPTASSALQVYIAKLRKLFDDPTIIITGNGGYRLRIDDSALDSRRFEHLSRTGQAALAAGSFEVAATTLRSSLDIWRGDALSDVRHLEGAQIEATRLEELRGRTIGDLIDAELAVGHHSESIAELEHLVDVHPLRERHWAQLMLALYRDGRQADALRAYRRASLVLGEELGIEPGPHLRELEEQILLHDPDLLLSTTIPASLTNLERQVTSFVGREQELERLVQLVRERPLVTLTGPGGSGKTRLAIKIGEILLPSYQDGVWIIDLSSIGRAEQVPYKVAEALSIIEQPGSLMAATVQRHVGQKQLLLIFDNCEHVLAAAAELVRELLSRCPMASVLATSRERLAIEGETTWTVPPLAFPSEDSNSIRVGGHDAVELFADRARLIDSEFELTSTNAIQVADICRRLDGLPLAIELAAARINVLSLDDISDRLADRFALLSRHSRFQPLRHSTLKAAIQWSYDLLDELERTLFRRLSVFSGRFLLEDAVDICDNGPTQPSLQVFEVLERLVEKSLVVAHTTGSGPTRYGLLETLRAFAADLQLGAGAPELIEYRHAQRFLRLAEEAEAELQTGLQPEWLDRLENDHDNLRASFDWLMGSDRIEDALRMGIALRWFWKMHDHVSEGADRLQRALARDSEVATTIRARALMTAGILRISIDVVQAYSLLEESLELAQNSGDMVCQGLSHGWMGLIDRIGDRLEDSRTHLTTALALLESAEVPWATAFVLGHLGVLAREQGHLDQAAVYHERALAIDRKLGNIQDEAWNLAGLGLIHLYHGDHHRAEILLGKSLVVHRELGFDFETASMAILLAIAAARAGTPDKAAGLLAEAADLADHLGSARLSDATHRARATVALESGEPNTALDHLSTAQRIRIDNGLSRSMFQRLFDDDERRLRSLVSPELLANIDDDLSAE